MEHTIPQKPMDPQPWNQSCPSSSYVRSRLEPKSRTRVPGKASAGLQSNKSPHTHTPLPCRLHATHTTRYETRSASRSADLRERMIIQVIVCDSRRGRQGTWDLKFGNPRAYPSTVGGGVVAWSSCTAMCMSGANSLPSATGTFRC